jgi:hypothetical protein
MNIDVDLTVEIDAEMVRQAVAKALLDCIDPTNFGANYLQKQKEIREVLDLVDFENMTTEICDEAEIITF